MARSLGSCFDPGASPEVNGVCILGEVNFDTGEVVCEVRDVTVSGFTIRGFSEQIAALGVHNATFAPTVAASSCGPPRPLRGGNGLPAPLGPDHVRDAGKGARHDNRSSVARRAENTAAEDLE